MTSRLTFVALLLPGCILLGGDDDSSSSGYAPQVTSVSPSSGSVSVPACGSVEFVARGEDADSIDLFWTFFLDSEVQSAGTSVDGTFDVTWSLPWTEDQAGSEADVEFSVSDGERATTVFWPVEFDGFFPCR